MIYKKIFFTLLVFLTMGDYVFCESKIRGKIVNSKSDKPIQDVNIYIKDQKVGATSDAMGEFELIIDKDSTYLVEFSHIAYKNVFIIIESNTSIEVRMEEVFLMMDDVIVSSMKCEYALSDVPVYTEVINKNKIIDSGSISVADILASHSGISRTYDPHGMFDYNLMGLESKYVLVLKNGKPIAGKFRDMVDLDQVLVSNIDRVEIIKGPTSSLYGSDAIGGVINIITHEISNDPQTNFRLRKSLFSTDADSDERSSGNLASFSIAKKLGKLNIGVSGMFQELLGQASITPLNKYKISKQNLNSELHWLSNSGKNELELELAYFDQRDDGGENLITGDALSLNATDINRISTMLSHDFFLSNRLTFSHSLNRSLYERKYTQRVADSTLLDASSFNMRNKASEDLLDYDGKLQLLMNNTNLLFGFNFSSPSHSNQRLVDTSHVTSTRALYFQNEYSHNKKLKLVGGLRVDNYGKKQSVNPRIAIMYTPGNKYKLRIALGKGFKAPSITETFIDFHNINQGYSVKGNPNLKPEESIGASANIEFSNKNNLRVNGLAYFNNFSNKILTDGVQEQASGETIFTYKNISEATYRGIELFADYIHSNRLSVRINANLRDDFDSNGNRLRNYMPYSTSFELNVFIAAIRTKMILIQSQSFRHATNTSFGILDLSFKTRFSQYLVINAGLKNITNYVDKINGPFRGRSIFLEITNN